MKKRKSFLKTTNVKDLMSKNIWILSLAILACAVFVSLAFGPRTGTLGTTDANEEYISSMDDQQDWNNCVQKDHSAWGGHCMNYGHSDDMYSVRLVNTCDQMVDLMCCVQRTNGQWHCFYRMDMKKSDTLRAYACIGSGKYLKWVRKAGDINTRFPTREEVNEQY